MKKTNLSLKKVTVKNTRDIDIYIKDAFGIEHRLFPKEEKKLIMLTKEDDHDSR